MEMDIRLFYILASHLTLFIHKYADELRLSHTIQLLLNGLTRITNRSRTPKMEFFVQEFLRNQKFLCVWFEFYFLLLLFELDSPIWNRYLSTYSPRNRLNISLNTRDIG